jgi:hypothetical protein
MPKDGIELPAPITAPLGIRLVCCDRITAHNIHAQPRSLRTPFARPLLHVANQFGLYTLLQAPSPPTPTLKPILKTPSEHQPLTPTSPGLSSETSSQSLPRYCRALHRCSASSCVKHSNWLQYRIKRRSLEYVKCGTSLGRGLLVPTRKYPELPQ